MDYLKHSHIWVQLGQGHIGFYNIDLFSRFVCAAGDILRNKNALPSGSQKKKECSTIYASTALPNAKGNQWLVHQYKRTCVYGEWTLHNFPLIMLSGIITTPLNCVNMLFSNKLCYV